MGGWQGRFLFKARGPGNSEASPGPGQVASIAPQPRWPATPEGNPKQHRDTEGKSEMPSLSPKRRAHAHAGQARSASTSISRMDSRLACGNPYLTLRCTQLGSDWHLCSYAKIKKKKRRSLHSARTPRSQEGRLLLHCKQRQPGGARQGVSARRARASQRASGHRSERRDQVSVKSQLSGGKTPSQRRRGAQRC